MENKKPTYQELTAKIAKLNKEIAETRKELTYNKNEFERKSLQAHLFYLDRELVYVEEYIQKRIDKGRP